MRAPKLRQKWTPEEEEEEGALKAAINKHGTGKWKEVQKDPEFGHCLAAHSNIDLMLKWKRMHCPKVKAAASVATPKVPKTPASIFQSPSPSQVLDPTKNTADGKPGPRYHSLEALSNIKNPNGAESADSGAIDDYIELRHEVPANSRRLSSSKLRWLVTQDELKKPNIYPEFCPKKKRSESDKPVFSSYQSQNPLAV
ncbi:hypothetical protein MKW94_027121 [Papaver nudicaule]|uniref:MYB transcription factor n=1 Tax=Papaver nudicaule TaxID=74823 RepID=A0AA41V5Q7_PAPNU|nr:hypothetical protein [Papaver nudicaule]